jgi:flagellar motor switch protein FliN
MEENNSNFSPDDFGLDSNTNLEKTESDNTSINKFNDSHTGRGVDLSRMKMVLDVPLKVTVELGRTKLLVNDLLQLGQGSVIELDKMAGEPMEIYVNDKLVAMGEVVVVNEKFGVRLTDVMSGIDIEENPPSEAV